MSETKPIHEFGINERGDYHVHVGGMYGNDGQGESVLSVHAILDRLHFSGPHLCAFNHEEHCDIRTTRDGWDAPCTCKRGRP